MIRRFPILALGLLLYAACGEAPPEKAPAAAANVQNNAAEAPPPLADRVAVTLTTSEGEISLELDGRRAPVTTANFLRYVDDRRFDGTFFYRAARTRGSEGRGFVQGGIRRDYRRMFDPIRHEPTSETGLRHVSGTVSMARTTPGTAMGDFFITVGDMPSMDRGGRSSETGDNEGYAAFGRVTGGMDVVRRILAAPTVPNAGRGAMRGQMMVAPVQIVSVRRAAPR
jgi:peptidyl-prolyl cis-trans isomerase A (cyclophilin A)